ncbi:MAG: hypothetical protein FWG50_00810 [Kiritimatiellaeota bacterium]|nr:hypothetical protein [Kiritimatiellota bacterium]
MRICVLMASLAAACVAHARQFTGPDAWQPVHTDVIKKWQDEQGKGGEAHVRVWNGVAADARQRTVRLLAEAVGHAEGVTTEFLIVGPGSDRAYEAAAVTVAKPSDIVLAMEHIGLPRGGGVYSRPFRFWPCGERVSATARHLSDPEGKAYPLQSLVKDTSAEGLLGGGGLVFAGGRWRDGECLADTRQPSAVISLYNEAETLFDVPFQASQGAVYGRVSLAKALPYGEVLEITLAPLPSKDGKPWVKQLNVLAAHENGEWAITCSGTNNAVQHKGDLASTLAWMKAEDAAGRDLFVTLNMRDDLPLAKAADVARVFYMLDGKGIKLDGKGEGGVYPRAFLPQEQWREREGRTPQPFEIHITPDAAGGFTKKLTFIEEDWTVEGLDPKLTPKDYPFSAWDDLPALIQNVGGEDSKVNLLFVFAPSAAPIKTFMPAIRALAERLPLVYVFGE